MKRNTFIFIFVLFLLSMMWGCPTKRYVPDPLNPQPHVEVKFKSVDGADSDQSYNWQDVLNVLKGEAPLVGPTPRFVRMLARTVSPDFVLS